MPPPRPRAPSLPHAHPRIRPGGTCCRRRCPARRPPWGGANMGRGGVSWSLIAWPRAPSLLRKAMSLLGLSGRGFAGADGPWGAPGTPLCPPPSPGLAALPGAGLQEDAGSLRRPAAVRIPAPEAVPGRERRCQDQPRHGEDDTLAPARDAGPAPRRASVSPGRAPSHAKSFPAGSRRRANSWDAKVTLPCSSRAPRTAASPGPPGSG